MKNNKNILIVASGPLPNDTIGIREAAGLRTHQFVNSLKNTDHNITLVCIHNNNDFSKQIEIDKTDKKNRQNRQNQNTYKNTNIIRLHRHDKNLVKKIKNLIYTDPQKNKKIDAIIGINTFPSFICSQICPSDIPFWADLNGWIMAESQARGFSEKTNIHFANAWKQEKAILDKADKISTVSTAQKFCTIGEMASTGNLTYQNFHTQIVHSIPNITDFFTIDKIDKKNYDEKLFRGKKIPKNAIVISHIGGYNNWVDTSTLFHAIDKAMSTCPNLYFVSTGGAIKDVSNKTFSDFLDKIDTSKNKEKYIFLGWINTEDMHKIYQESDIGINVDFLCTETETGARNRLNEMIKFQLPIITTGGSEIAETIGKYKAGECVPNQNIEILTDKIIKMTTLAKASQLSKYKENCEFLHTKFYTSDKIMSPFLTFLQNPKIRNKQKTKQNTYISFFKNAIWYLQKNGIRKTFYKFIQRFL